MQRRFQILLAILASLLTCVIVSPAQAVDPITAVAVASWLRPQTTRLYVTTNGVASGEWYVRNELRGYWRESSGVGVEYPNIGTAAVPVHFPNEYARSVIQAWVAEDDRADGQLDKPADKGDTYHQRKHRGGSKARQSICDCEICTKEAGRYTMMHNDGGSWFFLLNLEDKNFKARPHTFKILYFVRGLEVDSTPLIPLVNIGNIGEYKGGLRECYTEVNLVDCRGANGEILDEFREPKGLDGLNYDNIFAVCPSLRPTSGLMRLQMLRRANAQNLLQLPNNGDDQQFRVSPDGTLKPIGGKEAPAGVRIEDTKKATDHQKVVDGVPVTPAEATPMGAAPPVTPSVSPDSKPAEKAAKKLRRIRIVNHYDVPVAFGIEYVAGGKRSMEVVEPGKSVTFEVPEGASGGFKVFYQPKGGETMPLPKGKEGTDFIFTLPEPSPTGGRQVDIWPPDNGQEA